MAAAAPIIGLQALSTASSTYASVQAQRSQAEFQQSQLELNRRMADIQAADAISRGDREALKLRGQTRRLIGSQRAAQAAGGVDINRGDALDIQAETASLGAADELTIKNNAYREAFGYKAQALSYGAQGAYAGLAARNSIQNTILTGGFQFANSAVSAGYYSGAFRSGGGSTVSTGGGGSYYAPQSRAPRERLP